MLNPTKPTKPAKNEIVPEVPAPAVNKAVLHQDNLLELERMLRDVQEFVNSVKDPTFGGVRLRMNKHLNQDILWLTAMNGNVNNISSHATSEHTNPLLGNSEPKKIMGRIVGEARQPIEEKQLRVQPSEKQKFSEDVNSMYKAFLSLKDKDVIATFSKPGGETLVRGVAKLAGIKDWQNCECDVVLFADIREAIRTKAKSDALNEEIDSQLENNNGGSANTQEEEDEV